MNEYVDAISVGQPVEVHIRRAFQALRANLGGFPALLLAASL